MSDVAGETIEIIAKHVANKDKPVQLNDKLSETWASNRST